MTIGHAAVYVRDLEGARAFFETYFQAASGPEYHNPDTHFRSYFLAFDGGARLELMTRPGLGAPRRSRGWAGPIWPSRWAAGRRWTRSPAGWPGRGIPSSAAPASPGTAIMRAVWPARRASS